LRFSWQWRFKFRLWHTTVTQ